MSLLDLIKDKPPVVPDGDVPWPPPNKNVEVSFSSTAAPFLTASPLFTARRTPSLREFLNPNYRGKQEEKEKDSISEPSDLLLAIEKNKSSNNLSKTDFDLQRKLRHKSSNISYNVEEKRLEKVAKDTEENQKNSVHKNLDSTVSGSLENKKDNKFLNPTLGDSTSSEKQDIFQKYTTQGVDNFDSVSESNVFVDNITNQDVSVTDSDVIAVKGQENKLSGQHKDRGSSSSAAVCIDKFVASKRKILETESEMTDEKSMKKAKRTDSAVEKQENKLFSDDNNGFSSIHTGKASTTKRKISEFESVTTDEESIKKVGRLSQDDCSGVTSVEKPSDTPEELFLTQGDSSDTTPSTSTMAKINAEDNVVSQESRNKVVTQQDLNSNASGITESNDKEELTHKVNTESVLPLKAEAYNTQKRNVEELADKVYKEQLMSLKTDSLNTQDSGQGKCTIKVHKVQEVTLEGDMCNTQSSVLEEYTDKVNEEEHLSLKTEKLNSDRNEKLDIASEVHKLPLKADEGSTQDNDVEESRKTEHVHVEEESFMNSEYHTTHCDEEERTLNTANNIAQEFTPSKTDGGSIQSMDKGHVEEGLTVKISDNSIAYKSDEERTLDTANAAQMLSLKANEGSTQSNDAEESLDKGYIEEGLSTSKNAQEKTLDIGNIAQELHLKADQGSTEKNDIELSMAKEHEEKENLHQILITEEVVHDKDAVQDEKELSTKTDAVCTAQKKETLQDGKQEADELMSLVTDACMLTPTTKGNDTVMNTTEKKRTLEEENRNDDLNNSLSNINSEAQGSTENKTELLKDSQKDNMFNIPKIPQNVKSQTLLRQKIFITDSSESSSTETEVGETDVKNAENQNHCSKEVLLSDKLLKFKNSTGITSGAAKDSTVDEMCNVHQGITVSKTSEINDSETLLKDTTIDSSSDSEDDSSTDEDDDEGQDNSKVDEESIEVLVFNDSDDDDDDGLEDGEIDKESTDESRESEDSMDKLEQDIDFSNLSEEKTGGKNVETLGDIKTSKGSKRKRKKKKKKLSKQSNTSKKIKSFPTKKATSGDPSTRKTFTKPMTNQSTTHASDSKNDKTLGDEKDQTQEEFSLLSTLTSTSVMDVTVAASEKELIKKKSRGGKAAAKRKKKLQRRLNEYNARRVQVERRRQEIRMEPLPMPVCKFYLNGSCNKGDECQFRHEGTPTKKPFLCKYYVSGVCDKGDSCPYQHNAYPCKNFHLGSFVCNYGDRCKYSHDAPTPETEVLFEQLFADSLREKNDVTDDGDGINQTSLTTSTDGNELPCNSSVRENLYSVRYGSIDEEDCEGSGRGVQEGDSQVKEGLTDCEEKAEAGQENESGPGLTPSYVVPGMYAS